MNHAILLSPAGIHNNAPFPVGLAGFLFTHVFGKIFNHVALPTPIVTAIQKIHSDVRNLPATRDLMTFISSNVVGGNKVGESPVWKSARIANSVF